MSENKLPKTTYFTQETHEALLARAATEGITASQLIQRYVEEGLEKPAVAMCSCASPSHASVPHRRSGRCYK